MTTWKSLEDELVYFRALSTLVSQAQRIAESDPYKKNIRELALPVNRGGRDALKQQMEDHFDRLHQLLAESFLLRLVAAFEAEAFRRIPNTIGLSRKAVIEGVPPEAPFARGVERLVRSAKDLRDLRGIECLVEAYPSTASATIAELREHRNFVAHGKRDSVGAVSTFSSPDDVYDALVEILDAMTEAAEPTDEQDDSE